uniref:Uncharacterized protein n=1 Tax=Opuntia streptacantha TaxID=393608 RepID=A0A7C9ERH8_OPUST
MSQRVGNANAGLRSTAREFSFRWSIYSRTCMSQLQQCNSTALFCLNNLEYNELCTYIFQGTSNRITVEVLYSSVLGVHSHSPCLCAEKFFLAYVMRSVQDLQPGSNQ